MRKKKIALVMIVLALTGFGVCAKDGTASCTFRTAKDATGVGYLTVSSSQMLSRTTIPEKSIGTAVADIRVRYKNVSGNYIEDWKTSSGTQTTETKYVLPAKTSERKATSLHMENSGHDNNVGYCSLW